MEVLIKTRDELFVAEIVDVIVALLIKACPTFSDSQHCKFLTRIAALQLSVDNYLGVLSTTVYNHVNKNVVQIS